MATAQFSSVLLEARDAVEANRRLMVEMRALRAQVAKQLSDVLDSAAMLAVSMQARTNETSLRPISAAIPIRPRAIDSTDQQALGSLTAREVEVLKLIGEGQRTKEIAYTLGITFKTAVTHRSNIMEKLGIHEGPRLVRFAIRTGICAA
jgi:DNA-binding NarL/FixJ family response regulator